MSHNMTGESEFIRNLLMFTESTDQMFEQVKVYEAEGGNLVYAGQYKNFLEQSLPIFKIMNIIRRLIDRLDAGIKFVPHMRSDTVPEGSDEINMITYHLDTIRPGRVNQDNERSRNEFAPRLRYTMMVNDDPDQVYDVYGQYIDNYVRFQFYGKTRSESEQMMVLFRRLMWVFTGTIQNSGVRVFRPEQGGTLRPDQINNKDKIAPLFLDYLVSTEDLYAKSIDLIKMIEIIVNENETR